MEMSIRSQTSSTSVIKTIQQPYHQVCEPTKTSNQLTLKLPRSWKCLKDSDGKPYFYHAKTKTSQLSLPSGTYILKDGLPILEITSDDSDSDSSPPPPPSPERKKKYIKKRESYPVRRIKRMLNFCNDSLKLEMKACGNLGKFRKPIKTFQFSVSEVVVRTLTAYHNPKCKIGRITSRHDFKYLARKLTHCILLKQLNRCESIKDLKFNKSVTVKVQEYISMYMSKFGKLYVRPKEHGEPLELMTCLNGATAFYKCGDFLLCDMVLMSNASFRQFESNQ